MIYQDQQPIPAHNNGHYYYVANDFISIVGVAVQFKFLHYCNAVKFARNKTITSTVYNCDGVPLITFSKIHEF